MTHTTRILTNEDLNRLAPSVFAQEAWRETSAQYRFLPTIAVLDKLREAGFNVVSAGQSRSRIEGKGNFTKHILRLRHNQYTTPGQVGDEIPEIVLINSHDRTSAYKLMLGIFRLVCSNGMIVASETIESLNIRHMGSRDLLENVIDVSGQVIDEAPKVMNRIAQYKKIMLTKDEQLVLANAANELNPTSLKVMPGRLLTLRRYADKPESNGMNSLWKTANVIQENLIRGGIRGVNEKGRTLRTRSIKCIQNNVNINKALWRLTEEMAKIKG